MTDTKTADEAIQQAREAIEREAEQSLQLGWRQRHHDALDYYTALIEARKAVMVLEEVNDLWNRRQELYSTDEFVSKFNALLFNARQAEAALQALIKGAGDVSRDG